MKLFLYLISVVSAKSILETNYSLVDNIDGVSRTKWELVKSKPEGRKYFPDWSDLDSRPLPHWYDQAKIGIFVHWGVYSVPSFHSEWFWYVWKSGSNPTSRKSVQDFMNANYPPGFSYQDFAPMFTAEFFKPDRWADLFHRAGAKYVVLTSKHHEGYALFPSKHSFSWNSVDTGPHRDIVGELAKAVRKTGIKFGLYHSLYEWYNPLYLMDKASNFKTFEFRKHKLWPDIKQLVEDCKPSVLWSDGDWECTSAYWDSVHILAWLYNESPVKDHVVVNDRWGIDSKCRHGDFYNCEDRYNPGTLQKHKWENAFTIDRDSWGYRRGIKLSDILTMEEILRNIVSTVSCGGNALINIGPTKDGTIPVIFEERLLALGKWLKINGRAIYATSPWLHQNDSTNSNVWYTCTKAEYNARQPVAPPKSCDTITAIYAIFLKWPADNVLKVTDLVKVLEKRAYSVQLLGGEVLYWNITNGLVNIELPNTATVISENAWALEICRK